MPEDPSRQVDARRFLEKRGVPNTVEAFVERIAESDTAAVRAFVESGFPVRELAAQGIHPLLVAARTDNAEVIATLLAAGAEADCRDEQGFTPLLLAARGRHGAAVRALAAGGAPLDSAGAHGRTVLMQVAADNLGDLVEFLLAHGAKPDLADENGRTALMIATAERRAEAVEALLLGGASLEPRDAEGQRAHDLAVKHRAPDVLRVIRKAEAGELKPRDAASASGRVLARPLRAVKESRSLRWVAGLALAAMVVLTGANLAGWLDVVLAPPPGFVPSPEQAARTTLQVGLEGIETFRRGSGRLPADLREAGLAGLADFRYEVAAGGTAFRLGATVQGVLCSFDSAVPGAEPRCTPLTGAKGGAR